jgi:hypothetical protein
MLEKMSKETLIKLLLMQVRNIGRVDGLYILGIEEKFGIEAAIQLDTNCWKVLGELEARDLKSLLKTEKNDIPALVYALRNTSWWLHKTEKQIEVSSTKAIFRVLSCRTQEARIRKALGVFPCKTVGLTYLKAFAQEFNPDIEVNCQFCPPDKRVTGVWCQWEFNLRRKNDCK